MWEGEREVSLCANLVLSSSMIFTFSGFSVDIRQVRPVSQVGHRHPAQLLSVSAENEFGFCGRYETRGYISQPVIGQPLHVHVAARKLFAHATS